MWSTVIIKTLGARLLVGSGREAAMTILGHHGGLTDVEQLRRARDESIIDEAETAARLLKQVPEAQHVMDAPRARQFGRLRPMRRQGPRSVARPGQGPRC